MEVVTEPVVTPAILPARSRSSHKTVGQELTGGDKPPLMLGR